MKSLRGYPATYSPISYEDVDITHLNYEEENAPKNYLEQIRYLLEEGNAITTLPLNTIGGYVGGAVMGKIGEYGSKYGGQVLDWSQNKFRSNLNNRMQGILTDTSGHSINIPEIAARRQQIYDNFVFQNADKEVLDYVPIITRYKGGDDMAVAKSIRRNMVKENPNFQWRKDENGHYDYEHFIKDPTRAEYLRTLPSTYKNPQYDILATNKEGNIMNYLLSEYYNPEIGKHVYDKLVKNPVNGITVTKFAREGKHGLREFEKVFEKGLSPQASEAGLGLSQTGNAPSSTLRVNDNTSPNKIIVNKKLPNVSNLYNELTAKTVYEKGRSSAGRQPTSLQNKNSAGRMRLSDLQTSPYYE